MVEVFKTDVNNNEDAERLISLIHTAFEHYKANFDLDDCDHILRIATTQAEVDATLVIALLDQHGFDAQILEDDAESLLLPFLANLF